MRKAPSPMRIPNGWGAFEIANGTTLFLDEIGELPLELQPKLLQVIETGEFERLGSSDTIKVDVRIIAATNRNLEAEVRKGTFREDLWYRLNIFPITMPPLRERREDIPLLVNYFIDKIIKKTGKIHQSGSGECDGRVAELSLARQYSRT
jgi:transcriptional regulator with GAF, ATPase, and Fis domain